MFPGKLVQFHEFDNIRQARSAIVYCAALCVNAVPKRGSKFRKLRRNLLKIVFFPFSNDFIYLYIIYTYFICCKMLVYAIWNELCHGRRHEMHTVHADILYT